MTTFRMSSIQFMANYQSSLNKTYQKQSKLLEQGDGSSIHRGSDNPVAYSKLLRYKVTASENEQYTTNVHTAKAWMETTDSALTHIAELTKTFKEKTIEAATDVNNTENFEALGKEMFALIEEIYATSKTQHDGRYVFSGNNDQTEPFTLSTSTVDRASVKTLNNSQANFFLGTSNSSKVYQFIKLQAEDSEDVYYMDVYNNKLYTQEFVEEGYLELMAQGFKNINQVDSDAYSAISDISADTDAAVTNLTDLLSSASITNADELTEVLKDIIKSSKSANDPQSIKNMSDLATLFSLTDSDTQITNILTNAGISTSLDSDFKKVLTDNENYINSYNSLSTGNYLSKQGAVLGDIDTAITLSMNGGKKTFNILTEPQQMISYHGDNNYISMVKINGATDTAADIVNTIGQDMFGSDLFDGSQSGFGIASGSSMINNMLLVYNHVLSGDVKWLENDGIVLADAANITVTNTQTTIGARLELYNSVDEMLGKQSVNITDQITDVSGTDVAKMATDLMEMTTLYNMALALGGRVLPQSLADYL